MIRRDRRRALLVGWFSFPGDSTVGDVEVLDVARTWLEEAGIDHDVALAPPLEGGVDWRRGRSARYSHVVLVCGPVWQGSPFDEVLARYHRSRHLAWNVSMLTDPSRWPELHDALARDGAGGSRVDLSIVAPVDRVPVVGLVRLPHLQPEYGDRSRTVEVDAVVDQALAREHVAVVEVDTRLPVGGARPSSPERVESVLARVDAVVTTRMHGLVLAIKNGVPAVAVDPVLGGGKVASQARVLGWPELLVAGELDAGAVQEALRRCLRPEARELAARARTRAVTLAQQVRDELLGTLG